MKKKLIIIASILAVCLAVSFVIFSSVGRAGGEIEFDAVVLSVEGNIITAEVIDDGASFFSAKLPDKIVFDANDSGESNLKVGDNIHGNYLKGTIDGDSVRVVSLTVNSTP